jgi:hypothetical protein
MFTSAHGTYESLTAHAGGYHGANNLQMQETEKLYNETSDAFTNIAMTATSDKERLSKLTTTNFTLTGQLAEKDKLIATLQAQLRINSNTPHQVSACDKNKHYCWNHGIRISSNHNSTNYHDPRKCPKRESSIDSTMGGKDAWQGRPVEDDKIKFNLANNLSDYP